MKSLSTVERIIEYLQKRGEASPKELYDHLGLTYQAVFVHLRKLQQNGIVFKVGTKPKVLYMLHRQKKSSEKSDKEYDPIEIFRENVGRVMNFAAIPIFGSADCGPAKHFADQNPASFMKISKRLLPKNFKDIFAIQAKGSSMNRANIGGRNIEDGDYVLIDSSINRPENGECVLSVIDGVANIKKFHLDRKNQQILLQSVSTQFFPPICIHPSEMNYYVNGKVIKVIKKVII